MILGWGSGGVAWGGLLTFICKCTLSGCHSAGLNCSWCYAIKIKKTLSNTFGTVEVNENHLLNRMHSFVPLDAFSMWVTYAIENAPYCWLLSPCRLCQALLSAPPPLVGVLLSAPRPLVGVWPVVRPLFLFPCPFRVCPLWARCVGVGVSLFPLLFCVPRLVSRLSSCHLISSVISFPCPFHPHLHLTCRSLKKPRCCGACVWTIWRDVKLLSFAGGPWALGWHGPTKTHPSCCAIVPAIFESWWDVANPRTTMQFFNIRLFELSTWTDEGGFSFIFLHSWHNLKLRWISCPLQFSAYIVGFFLASIDFIPFFKVATKEFSFHSTPNTLLFLSGVAGLFLHVRCTPQQNLQWQFWASVCVCTIGIDVKLLYIAGGWGSLGVPHLTKTAPSGCDIGAWPALTYLLF